MNEDLEKVRLETENLQLKCALEFYAEGRHLWHADKRDATTHKEYDSVSGVVENGAYAFGKLREIEDELPEKTGKLEAENARLRKTLAKARHYLSKVDCYRENIADEADYFWKVKIDEALKGSTND